MSPQIRDLLERAEAAATLVAHDSDMRPALEIAIDVLEEVQSYTSCEASSPAMTEECARAVRIGRAALAAPAPVAPPDEDEVRAAYRAADERGQIRHHNGWQMWRDAVAWSVSRGAAPAPIAPITGRSTTACDDQDAPEPRDA